MTTVEFIQFDAPYQVGERKECTPGEAAKLERSGVARKVPSRRSQAAQDESAAPPAKKEASEEDGCP